MCATPCLRTISRMRVRARHRCLQHAMGAAAKDAEREQQRDRRVGDGAGGSSSKAGRQQLARAERRLAVDEASVS